MSINVQKAEFILSAASPKDFRRDALPQVAFAGRSNVGKSSVINRLLNRKNFARVGAAPGKTTQINYFKIDNAFYLVDLPGYGYARVSKGERDRWGRLMEGYFADPELMTLGVMIVDARHKPTADDCTMAQWYRGAGCPFLVVANKLDKLKKSEVEGNLQRIRETLELGEEDMVIPFSAEKGMTMSSSPSSRVSRMRWRFPSTSLFFSLSSLLATTRKGQPAPRYHWAMVQSSAVGLCLASTIITPRVISSGSAK